MKRIAGAYFDELYGRSADPWNFASSPYEREKYRHTARVLGRTASLLEIGCSIGRLTGILAEQCDQVLATDVSQRALDLAQAELAARANVRLALGSFPEWMPTGPWEAILCSEVLYYLDLAALELAAGHLEAALSGGTRVLLVHWRLPAPSNTLQGDQVHDRLLERLGAYHVLDDRRRQYRLDLLHA